MMRKIIKGLFLVIFIFYGAGCDFSGKQPVSIDVAMVHIPKNTPTAYLDEIKPVETITVDTASIDPLKGAFQFRLYPRTSASLFRIRVGSQMSFFLIVGDKDIQVTGDFAQAGDLKISGSPESTELQQFITALNKQNLELQDRLKDIETPKKVAGDSLLRVQKYQLELKRQALLDTILNAAGQTESPVVAVFALSILDSRGAWDKGKPVFDGLETRFPRSSFVREAVDRYKKKLNNQGLSMAVGIGDQAPDISYPDPEGKMISLADYKGKFVLVDFWASWCAPCREANPGLVKIYKRFKNNNFSILGVSLDSKKTSWEKAIQKDGLTWNQISDLKGWNSLPAATYGVEAIPANFLVNPEGKVIAKNLHGDSLAVKLRSFLK